VNEDEPFLIDSAGEVSAAARCCQAR
jgi:hypothetical protein